MVCVMNGNSFLRVALARLVRRGLNRAEEPTGRLGRPKAATLDRPTQPPARR